MINSIFLPLVFMSFLVAYKKFKTKKKKFSAPPTHQLPSQLRENFNMRLHTKLNRLKEDKTIKIIKQISC